MRLILLLLGALLLFNVSAGGLLAKQALPKVEVSNKGQLTITAKNDVKYQDWSSTMLTGKARLVLHIASKKSANDINLEAMQAVTDAKLDPHYFQTTTIVNGSDSVWGTAKFIRKLLEERTLQEPDARFVLDNRGRVRKAWDLQTGDSAILIVDANNQLLWHKEGKLDVLDIEGILEIIRAEITRLTKASGTS
ncbi:hypothetical protein DU002_05725 [Corallincola holothuriorum]|uniref:YtfJ family protein n=1 Tax=Corallincola holothuriorum TaxID=2282215 RepID=A0A368NLW6_9GAMM|nr:YtfJ family protein [Corallincola holothuriorum]RCU50825.1 hypothetical protein DU002_05725 [Corallincola holothuriorum]